MAGAYVAKPAVPPTPDPPVADPPPGWNPNWPFPGPLPPGYVPEYTFPVTATAVVKIGEAAAVAGSARQVAAVAGIAYDHVTYITNEPDVAALGATVSGEVISLSPPGASFSEGAYWNISDNITFGITKANEGQTITLVATSAIGGEIITGTTSISIYAYDYSLNLSGDESIEYDEATSVTVTLRDHGTLKSDDPGSATLTWTATLDGGAVDLKFSGDAGYGSSVESEYSDLGDYYGAEEDIEFDLEEEDEERTVVLRVESTVYGDALNETLDITIDPAAMPVSFTANLNIDSFDINAATSMIMRLKVRRGFSDYDWPQLGCIEYADPPPDWWYDDYTFNDLDEVTCSAGGQTITASGTFLEDSGNYYLFLDVNVGGNSSMTCTWTVNVTMSDGTVHTDTYNFSLIPWAGMVFKSATIYMNTGKVWIFGNLMNP